jgi:hypothetical protein
MENNILDNLNTKIDLQSNLTEKIKSMLANRAKFNFFTRFDRTEYGGFGEAPDSLEVEIYLTMPHCIVNGDKKITSKNPPFNTKELAEEITPDYTYNKVFFYEKPVIAKGPYFLISHYFFRTDPAARPVVVANMLLLEKKDFDMIQEILKKNPANATDIFYKIPTIIALEKSGKIDEYDLKEIFNHGSSHDPHMVRASFYFVEGKQIEGRETQVLEWDGNKINVHSGKKKVKEFDPYDIPLLGGK